MKRMFDIIASAIGIVCVLPLALPIGLAILITMGRPVLFCQYRPGRFGKPFKILKFRTMTTEADAFDVPLHDRARITNLGWFLRATSLDELPGLWNVLTGNMSLVGPRPLLMEYVPLYSDRQTRRHEVRPGITGWAQINGRNAIGWEEKFELDVWYVDNRSFWLDLTIIWATVRKVIAREGISGQGEATMSKFTGNSE